MKLDAVDEVIKLFTEAIDMMEANQIIEDDERASTASTNASTTNDNRQSALLALAGTPSTSTTAANSNSSSGTNSDSEDPRASGGNTPIVNKAVAGLASAALTVDYSSPSSKTRSLGGKAAPKDTSARPSGSTGLGLGLGKNVNNPPVQKQVGVLGLGHGSGTHKPSSRATTGLNALSQSSPSGTSSPVSPTTPDSANDENEAGNGPSGPLKNKLVAKLAGAPSNREYPSPKLGPRSLSGAPKASPTPSTNPAANGLALPQADTLGRDSPNVPIPAGAASPDADDEAQDEPEEGEEGDLILTDKKNSVFNRVKSTLPVTASPKQIRSSAHLLELATTHSLAADDDDLTMRGQGNLANGAPTDRPMSAGGVLSSLPTGMQSTSTNSTPKPSYLRRLDSPETHHGQLLAAKSRLQLLLNKGIQLADRIDLAAVPQIKAKLEIALAKLEASLVVPTIGPQ